MTIQCRTTLERWPFKEPFEISRETMADIGVLVAHLGDGNGLEGRGEACGVPYDGETPASMAAQIEAVRHRLRADTQPDELADLLPPGGARNALDCAYWDLRAKQARLRIWDLMVEPHPVAVNTAYTIGLGSDADVRRKIRAATHMPLLKLKADATRHLNMVRIAREEHPGARLVIDANQAWSRSLLEELLPDFADAGVELIEQPVPRGTDAQLDGLRSPIPLAADESCTDRASLSALMGLYQFINIKLDKSGGLSEGLALALRARELGFGLMVGNMGGTSLSMAPAFLVAQHCTYIDLDGPLLLREDRQNAFAYDGPTLPLPTPALWG